MTKFSRFPAQRKMGFQQSARLRLEKGLHHLDRSWPGAAHDFQIITDRFRDCRHKLAQRHVDFRCLPTYGPFPGDNPATVRYPGNQNPHENPGFHSPCWKCLLHLVGHHIPAAGRLQNRSPGPYSPPFELSPKTYGLLNQLRYDLRKLKGAWASRSKRGPPLAYRLPAKGQQVALLFLVLPQSASAALRPPGHASTTKPDPA